MQRYFSNKLDHDYFSLNEDDLYHIKTVMRMKDGDFIEIVYQNDVFIGCLENVNTNVKIKMVEKCQINDKKTPAVTIIIPFLKESKMDLILQKSTELGVDKIIILPMKHSQIKVKNDVIMKKLPRWNRICKEASEQSKHNFIPPIQYIDNIKKLEQNDGLNLVCSTIEKEKNIKNVLLKNKIYDKINLVIGPEGGLDKEEEQYLNSIGFISISLGDEILRVETVPICVLSMINYEYME